MTNAKNALARNNIKQNEKNETSPDPKIRLVQVDSHVVHLTYQRTGYTTSQLLPISRNKKFQRDGEGRIDKGGGA